MCIRDRAPSVPGLFRGRQGPSLHPVYAIQGSHGVGGHDDLEPLTTFLRRDDARHERQEQYEPGMHPRADRLIL